MKMKKGEIKTVGEKITSEAYDSYKKMALDDKIKYVDSILDLIQLDLNIIIKSMVECDFPTLSADETIGHYASEFLDKVITDITLISGDLNNYEDHAARINALVKFAGKLTREPQINEKFGFLTVIGKSADKRYYYTCRCERCGNIKDIRKDNLFEGNTVSCGCYRNALDKIKIKKMASKNIVDGVNVGQIKSKKVRPNSTTGIRGVSYRKSDGKYTATIGFKGKQIYLCKSNDINVCIAARKEAEKKYFGEFLEKLTETEADEAN